MGLNEVYQGNTVLSLILQRKLSCQVYQVGTARWPLSCNRATRPLTPAIHSVHYEGTSFQGPFALRCQ